jgi:adenylyl- and sulfurtransferase ThiI
LETQVKIIQLLSHIENRLENVEEKTEEVEKLLAETKKKKADVPNLTKVQTVSKLSKIWACTRKLGFEAFKKVFDMAIDEGVKSIFDGRALLLLHMAHQI